MGRHLESSSLPQGRRLQALHMYPIRLKGTPMAILTCSGGNAEESILCAVLQYERASIGPTGAIAAGSGVCKGPYDALNGSALAWCGF
jgi:hypothetical protein